MATESHWLFKNLKILKKVKYVIVSPACIWNIIHIVKSLKPYYVTLDNSDNTNFSIHTENKQEANFFFRKKWKKIHTLKTRNKTTIWPSNPNATHICIYPEKTIIEENACTPVFTATLFTIASTWKHPLIILDVNISN